MSELPGMVKSRDVLSDVSVSMAFICLLHLANEKGLEIKDNKSTLTSLTIVV